MGTTPNRLLPYAEPSDPVAEYPATDKAAMEILDTALGADSGWIAIAILPGFAAHTEPPQVRKIGSVVYSRGSWLSTGITINTSKSIGTIPVGFRPIFGFVARFGTDNGNTSASMYVLASGTVQIRSGSTLSANYFIPGCIWMTD